MLVTMGPGLVRVPYCKALRLLVLLGLSLACGFLLGLLLEQGGEYRSFYTRQKVELVQRAAWTAWEAEGAQSATEEQTGPTTSSPFTSFLTTPPHFVPHPDFPFRYLINEPHLCDGEVYILNMVPVSTSSFGARQRIRALWGNKTMAALTNTGMRTVFVLGVRNKSQKEQRQIEEESHAHHDIIQVDFVDTYRNLTLKVLTMLHWTLTYCPHATWLLKSDDDVFLDPFALKNLLTQHEGANLVCRVYETPKVCRVGHRCPGKWAVSTDEYPHERFPSHCGGAAYALSASTVEDLYTVANKTHPFFIEDVYITGILSHSLSSQFQYVDVPDRYREKAPAKFSKKFWDGTILFSMFNRRIINASSYALWNRVVEYNNLTSLLAFPGGLRSTCA